MLSDPLTNHMDTEKLIAVMSMGARATTQPIERMVKKPANQFARRKAALSQPMQPKRGYDWHRQLKVARRQRTGFRYDYR